MLITISPAKRLDWDARDTEMTTPRFLPEANSLARTMRGRTLADFLADEGLDFHVRQRFGDMHAYLDSEEEPGMMIQLMARHQLMLRLFDVIQEGARSWDGETRPLRKIDWSTGTPRVADEVQ